MPDIHSKFFSASASHRWMGKKGSDGCAASVLLPQREEGNTAAADEGTMGHFFTEQTLRLRVASMREGADPLQHNVADFLGQKHATWRLAENHIVDLQGYVNFVWALVQAGGRLYIETQVDYSQPLGVDHLEGILRAFGTSDAVVIMPNGTAWIIDLKFGHWEVDAEINTQMMCYALGVYRRLRLVHDIQRFRLVIYQPRTKGRPDDQWAFTFEQMAIFVKAARLGADRIMEALEFLNTTGKVPPQYYRPTVDNCQFCKVEECGARKKSWGRR